MLKLTKVILKAANILNWLAGVISVALVFLYIFARESFSTFLDYKADFPEYSPSEIAQYETVNALELLLMVMTFPIIHFILVRLVKMIDDLSVENIFNFENSERLKAIAWALVVINFLYLGIGLYSEYGFTIDAGFFGSSYSFVDWFAALLIFILAKIFKEGTAMRHDLEGTI